jgi:hypothetical protein
MDIKFKVEIEVDDEKVVAEDKYYLGDVYAAIDRVFKYNNIPKLESNNEKFLTYGTKKHDKFSNILVSVNTVILSEINPYIKKATWYNYELNEQEDILETFRKERLIK